MEIIIETTIVDFSLVPTPEIIAAITTYNEETVSYTHLLPLYICPHPGTINERAIPRTPYLRVKDRRSNRGAGTSATPNST